MIFKKKKYTLKKELASETLASVLDEIEKSSSTPIDEMLTTRIDAAKSYSKYSTLVIGCLVFTLLCPLIFVFTSNSRQTETSPDISIADYYVQGDMLYIDLDGSFIDYTSIYAVSSSGSTVFPSEYNSGTGLITFIYDKTEWNIYVSDLNHLTAHMLLTPPQ